MNLLRLMLLACVLLAQVWPAQAASVMGAESTPACQEGCCAWLMQEGISVCSCEEAPAPVAPAGLPPLGGRELVPQVVWAEVSHDLLPEARPAGQNKSAAILRQLDDENSAAPEVRLAVLFCTFLN